MKEGQKIPSFKIWLIALVVGLSVISAVQFSITKSKNYIFNDFIAKKYQKYLQSADSSKKKIIIVGNSLTRFAIPYNPGNGFSFSHFRIVNYGFNLTEYIPLLEALSEQKPDYIFIQTDVMFINIDLPPDHKIDLLKYIVLDPKYTLEGTDFYKQNTESGDLTMRAMKKKNIEIKDKIEFLADAQKYDKEKISLITSFLNKMKQKDIRIVFFDIPHSVDLQSILDSSKQHKEFNTIINQVASSVNAPRLTTLSFLPDSLFLDHSHLNVTGRDLFSSAFFRKIDSITGGIK